LRRRFSTNAIFFTYCSLVLTDLLRHRLKPKVRRLVLCVRGGNFLGPLLLGRMFDTLGEEDP